VCGERPTITHLIDYHQFCGVPNPRNAAREPETKLNPGEIEVTEVKRKLDRGDDFLLIDVREPNEHKIASIPGARLIPLGEFAKHVGELDSAAEIVIHCKSGMRSAKACGILRNAGFTNVRNMKGGILAWSSQVDPSVPKY
jgi:adenylyltransferase/sulfurtransferase